MKVKRGPNPQGRSRTVPYLFRCAARFNTHLELRRSVKAKYGPNKTAEITKIFFAVWGMMLVRGGKAAQSFPSVSVSRIVELCITAKYKRDEKKMVLF